MDLKKTGRGDMFFPNYQQFLESAMSQEFFLPMPIMKYIWENPSLPQVYQKLIKCCKLFFLKNPILVLKNLEYYEYLGVWKCCKESTCCEDSCGHELEKIDIDKVESRIWVSKKLVVYSGKKSNVASALIPKIYRIDVKSLHLYNQHLSYDELKFFVASGVEECSLNRNIVKYENDEEVPLENIIQLFSGAKSVSVISDSINAACKNYDDFIQACQTIEKVKLSCSTVVFDVPTFYQHLKHSNNRSLIEVHSRGDRQRIDEIVTEIVQKEFYNFKFVPPVILSNVRSLTYLTMIQMAVKKRLQ